MSFTAPDLADLLTALTPAEAAALATEVADDLPPGMLDQFTAAAQDTTTSVARLGESHPTTPAGIPDPVLVSIVDLIHQWAANRASYCTHAPDQRRPEPVYAAAWRPGLIVCARCTHLLRLPRGSDADRTCDLCGRVVPGLDHGEGIHADAVQYGPLAYLFGSCPDCHRGHDEVVR